VSRLVRAGAIALRTTPTAIRLLAVALAASLFLTISYLGVKDLHLTSAADAGRAVQTALAGGLVMFLAGIVAGTAGHRHGTLPALALVAPSRREVVLAQALATAGAAALAGLACAVAVTAAVLALTGLGGGAAPAAGTVVRVLVTVPAFAALAAVAGLGLGALVRSQPAALALGLLLVLVAEPAVATFSDLAGRFGPTGAGAGLVGIADADAPAAGPALAVLVAYAAAALAAGVVATERRDL
jgi:hypothetical protein